MSDVFVKWATAASAATVAESVTLPLEVMKVRLQLQNELGAAPAERRGLLAMARHVMATEGVRAMYAGWSAAVIRQCVYGGIGIGFYQPVRNLITGDAAHPPLYKKVLAAATTGAIGNAIATPCDVVKVRLQADGRLGRQRYSGTFDAFRRIPAEEGLRGLYKGVTPTVARAAFINGAGIASYDHSKHLLLVHSSLGDSTPTHALASGVSGLMSAVVSVPFDVVKTRIMNQHRDRPVYSGVVDCFAQTLRNEGPRALYKGFLPAYLRLAPWQLTFFLAYEQISRVFLGSSFQTTNARA